MSGLRLEVWPTASDAIASAAGIVTSRLAANPGLVLGLATGSTMVPFYRRLRHAHAEGRMSLAGAAAFGLDEYAGLPDDDPASFRNYLRRHLFDGVDLPLERIFLLDGGTGDAASECRRFEAAIAAAGGIDLQVLGIGTNAHIGFNEPGSAFDSRTRPVELSEATRAANAGAFAGRVVPRRALTMGIGTILGARELLLLATGRGKRAAVAGAVDGPIGPSVPASALRLHPCATIVCDAETARDLVKTTP